MYRLYIVKKICALNISVFFKNILMVLCSICFGGIFALIPIVLCSIGVEFKGDNFTKFVFESFLAFSSIALIGLKKTHNKIKKSNLENYS